MSKEEKWHTHEMICEACESRYKVNVYFDVPPNSYVEPKFKACPRCEVQGQWNPEEEVEQYGDRLDDSLFEFVRLVNLFRDFPGERTFQQAIMLAPGTAFAAKVEEADMEDGVARLTLNLSRLKLELSQAEGWAISEGYVPDIDGKRAIDGKNESTRKVQQAEIVRDDESCTELRRIIAKAEDKLLEAKRGHAAAKDMRRYVESLRDGLMAVLRWKEAEGGQ